MKKYGKVMEIGDKVIVRLRYSKKVFDLSIKRFLDNNRINYNYLYTLDKKNRPYVVIEAIVTSQEFIEMQILRRYATMSKILEEINYLKKLQK